ncbi:MAG TPA: ABC transporter ATP-binding protein [Bacteroidota bacterium]|nr:ABC transporter ATP-binding protein [Bacteroidota bacterium]
MNEITFTAEKLSKKFNRRTIFSDISILLHAKNSLAITGKNGSGKSTLVKILSGVLSPTRGSISLQIDGVNVAPANHFSYFGLVSPYLQLYDEFTGMENLELFNKIRGLSVAREHLQQLLQRVNLHERQDDLVRTYSSGMKQRLKYAFALFHKPPILFLDEPTSNLDAEGIETVRQIIKEQKSNGILIIATNDDDDVKLCDQRIDLNSNS